MSCETEREAVEQASDAVAEAAASSASLCAQLGHDSTECQGSQAEVAALRGRLSQAQAALQKCLADAPPASLLLELEGHVTFLLVVEQGMGYGGGSSNWIDAEVIFKLDSRPDKGFGFQLRDDPLQPVRRGMLALLQDAVVHGLKVITDYIEMTMPPNQNSIAVRVALTKLPQPSPPLTLHP